MVGSDSIRLRHLTLATDLTARSDRAFDHALYLARKWNARLLVVHAVEEEPLTANEPSWRRGADPVRVARRKLQFEYPGWEQVDSAIEVAIGKPYDMITGAAEREQTDLVITGVARENPYGADDLGTLVPALAKSAPSPILVVKKRLATAPRRVVVASDLTDTSHSALRLALDLFGPGRLTLFNAFAIPYRGLAGDKSELERSMQPAVVEECKAVLVQEAGAAAAAQIEIVAELGEPASVLAKYVADHDIDLVVTGTYGHTGVMEVLLGSTAMDIMSQVSCDVLVARKQSKRQVV